MSTLLCKKSLAYLIIDRQVKTLGTLIDLVILLASFSNGRSVNYRSPGIVSFSPQKEYDNASLHINKIRRQSFEEQPWVFSPSLGQVHMLEQHSRKGSEVFL
jgi:hypothetical protein